MESVVTSPVNNNLPQGNNIYSLHFSSQNKQPTGEGISIFGDDGFTFGDLVDIVNPLQHIPIISNIYRKITGDTIAPAMEIAGGALFGGPIGALASVVSVAISNSIHDTEIEVDPSGIDPATVAGTYPFGDNTADNHNKSAINNHIIKTGNFYGDGIYNPAAVSNNSIAALDIKELHNEKDLYAGVNEPITEPIPLNNSRLINDVYKNNQPLIDMEQKNQPMVDIMIGAPSGAG